MQEGLAPNSVLTDTSVVKGLHNDPYRVTTLAQLPVTLGGGPATRWLRGGQAPPVRRCYRLLHR